MNGKLNVGLLAKSFQKQNFNFSFRKYSRLDGVLLCFIIFGGILGEATSNKSD